MTSEYNFGEIERKWQQRWQAEGTHTALNNSGKPKFFAMEMFPYPSGAGLHGGHVKNYVPTDAFCRFKAMRGFNVMYPTGWDAFGQPAENEAIKQKRNPKQMVEEYANNFRNTMKRLGLSYDWTREINTSHPDYYKWTQWFFLLLFKRGLAYRSSAPINWCSSCKTGLANEEVKEGRCWRCDSSIEKRMMPQWYFKITDYADRLAADLDSIEWAEGVKQTQREWIGKSTGAEIDFAVAWSAYVPSAPTDPKHSLDPGVPGSAGFQPASIKIFTTRPDTIYGATFMVIAPEHPLVDQITTPEQRESVTTYVKRTERESALQRQSTQRSFTGVFTGAHAINPVNQEHIPIWIADYVLADYGTGAIMAVPAHDQRDFEFARKYNLPIRMVYESPDAPRSASEMTQALAESGVMINSGEFNGSPNNKETISRFIDWLQSKQLGKARITYKLRDWLVSRQRYWGVPIPIIHCPSCGPTAVPDSDLPVKLPDVENFHPPDSGESPLATIEDFVNTKCPDCSKPARRETDTMAGFACSSWYFLRYADPQNNQEFAASDKLAYWLPVDLYTGGTEHAVMHLLYARFWTKVMYDAGLVSFTEPFRALRNQGTMLAWTPGRRPRQEDLTETEEQATTNNQIIDWIVLKPEERAIYPADQIVWRWARMSKSKGNGINPDDIINENGADCLRLYILFVAPFEDNVQWSENGLVGASRFINRLWRWVINAMTKYDKNWDTQHPSSDNWTLPMDRGISAVAARTNDPTSLLAADKLTPTERQVRRKLHQTVRKVGNDLENFQFNTAVAALMELVNELYAYCPAEPQALATANGALLSEILSKLIPITAPLIPHVADEFWSRLGKNTCLSKTPWPDYDQEICREDEVTLVVQVNGKIRDRIPAPIDAPDETLRALALSSPLIADFIKDKTIVKIIVVPNKLVNIVVK